MMFNIDNISNIGDIFAIPFFAMLVYYFISIKNRNIIEYILLLFSIAGLSLDIIFTIQYIFL